MRNVNIKYTIKVNDHSKVATNSIHWMGVGLQAGEKILWVEQQSIEIVKVKVRYAIKFLKVFVRLICIIKSNQKL